ncbi:hypothetical protein ACQVTS_32935 [Bacillus mycoides]
MEKIYIANYLGHTVSVIDGRTNQVISTIPVSMTWSRKTGTSIRLRN